jgi:transcription elongation factor Elf1
MISRRYRCPVCGHKGRTNNKRRTAVKTCGVCRSEFDRVTGAVLVESDYLGDSERYLFEEGFE